ncbi:MAG: retention module-containing protein, partial [Azonexus sp.]|nr:retention module-containing protein [Azonexus sp.]
MAQAQVIATVSSLSGQAFARDSAGKMRRLKAGDQIREGEAVVAADGSEVNLKLANGREITVRPGETARLDAEVAALVMPDAADSAIASNQKGFQTIAKALTSGGELDDLLEDPAAGALGLGGNEGHSFVEFLRVVETVDPLAFQFGTERGRVLDTFNGAPLVRGDIQQVSVTSTTDTTAGTITLDEISADVITAAERGLPLTISGTTTGIEDGQV